MKSFLVLLKGKQTHLIDDSLIDSHVSYLKTLQVSGHLALCGPFIDNKNALFVIRAESKSKTEQLIRNDPFIKEGYYQGFIINEFTEANDKNNWLQKS